MSSLGCCLLLFPSAHREHWMETHTALLGEPSSLQHRSAPHSSRFVIICASQRLTVLDRRNSQSTWETNTIQLWCLEWAQGSSHWSSWLNNSLHRQTQRRAAGQEKLHLVNVSPSRAKSMGQRWKAAPWSSIRSLPCGGRAAWPLLQAHSKHSPAQRSHQQPPAAPHWGLGEEVREKSFTRWVVPRPRRIVSLLYMAASHGHAARGLSEIALWALPSLPFTSPGTALSFLMSTWGPVLYVHSYSRSEPVGPSEGARPGLTQFQHCACALSCLLHLRNHRAGFAESIKEEATGSGYVGMGDELPAAITAWGRHEPALPPEAMGLCLTWGCSNGGVCGLHARD